MTCSFGNKVQVELHAHTDTQNTIRNEYLRTSVVGTGGDFFVCHNCSLLHSPATRDSGSAVPFRTRAQTPPTVDFKGVNCMHTSLWTMMTLQIFATNLNDYQWRQFKQCLKFCFANSTMIDDTTGKATIEVIRLSYRFWSNMAEFFWHCLQIDFECSQSIDRTRMLSWMHFCFVFFVFFAPTATAYSRKQVIDWTWNSKAVKRNR